MGGEVLLVSSWYWLSPAWSLEKEGQRERNRERERNRDRVMCLCFAASLLSTDFNQISKTRKEINEIPKGFGMSRRARDSGTIKAERGCGLPWSWARSAGFPVEPLCLCGSLLIFGQRPARLRTLYFSPPKWKPQALRHLLWRFCLKVIMM